MNKKKFKSIKKQLLGRTIWAMSTQTVMLFAMILISASVLTQNILDITMKQMAINSANSLQTRLHIFRLCMEDIVDYPIFENYATDKESIVEFLDQKSEEYWCFTSFVDTSGYDYATGNNVSGETFFQKSMQGENYASSPYSADGNVLYVISMPAYRDDQLIGVMYMTPDYDYLYSLTTATSVGETGHIYVINHKDEVILAENIEEGMRVGATAHGNKTSSHLKMEELAVSTVDGAGFGNYMKDGTPYVGGYAPVPDTDGWVLITTASSFEFLSQLSFVVFGSLILSVVIMTFFIIYVTKSIVGFLDPVRSCVERIHSLAEGDLHSDVPDIRQNNEVGLLAESTHKIVNSLNSLIKDEQLLLERMANGDFSHRSQAPQVYIGDFAPLLVSLERILDSMNHTMLRISNASVQVTSGAEHMATSSVSLAEGAKAQATSTEELSVVLEHLSGQVNTSAQRATHARELTENTGKEVQSGNRYMSQLLDAMDDISSSSQKIEQIIKNIEDIAFQTNILALNAAVEAARAGSKGSGFAVVADEVRNLANRSADNAKETAVLIHGTLEAVQNGTDVAHQTAESLAEIVRGVEEAIDAISDIAVATEEQSGEILKITENMDEITGVIKNTSETSKEGAETSQKLSDQATTLRELMEHFTLR